MNSSLNLTCSIIFRVVSNRTIGVNLARFPQKAGESRNQEINGMNPCRSSPGMNVIRHSPKSTPNARMAFGGFGIERGFYA